MIDGCVSFLCYIVSYVINKLAIGYAVVGWKGVLYSPYFLGGKEDSGGIEEEIESMFREGSLAMGIIFVVLGVEV